MSCALRRFNGHGAPCRPSNTQLHNENEMKLKELMNMRAQQDQGVFCAAPPPSYSAVPSLSPIVQHPPSLEKNTIQDSQTLQTSRQYYSLSD